MLYLAVFIKEDKKYSEEKILEKNVGFVLWRF